MPQFTRRLHIRFAGRIILSEPCQKTSSLGFFKFNCLKSCRHGFHDAIGVVDGTTFVFDERPDSERANPHNFTRKSRYAMHGLIVCDHSRRIIAAYVGGAGAAHDSRVFYECSIAMSVREFFTGAEYLLGDAGFGVSAILITPFRGAGTNLPEEEKAKRKAFNASLSRPRVVIEHTIGSFLETLMYRYSERAIRWHRPYTSKVRE